MPISAYAGDYSARSYISIDCTTGAVLCEGNAYQQMPMASTTKIMTCLLACESGRLDDEVTITYEMLDGVYGTMVYLKPDDRISLLDLVKGAMLASGNDCANAIAFYLSGGIDSFAEMMNSRAHDIGMESTSFVTPSGLDSSGHYSTAYDMALLAREAMRNTVLCDICSQRSADIIVSDEPRKVYNHNKLLGDDAFCGIKTGYTDTAGRCLVSAYQYNGNIIITVTLNAPNDWDDHRRIVEESKAHYSQMTDCIDFDIDVVGGIKNMANVAYSYEVYSVGDISVNEYYYPFIYAPIKAGDAVGVAKIYSNNELITTVEITAVEGIEKWQITK